MRAWTRPTTSTLLLSATAVVVARTRPFGVLPDALDLRRQVETDRSDGFAYSPPPIRTSPERFGNGMGARWAMTTLDSTPTGRP